MRLKIIKNKSEKLLLQRYFLHKLNQILFSDWGGTWGTRKKQPRYGILARIFSFAHRLELTEGQSLLQKALLAAFMTQEESGKNQKSFCSTEILKTVFQTDSLKK